MDVQLLEPVLMPGHQVTLLCEVIVYDNLQLKHCLKTALRGVHVKFAGCLPSNATVVLITGVTVQSTDNGCRLVANESSMAYPRPYINLQDLSKVVELCSGAGFLGFGLEHSGFEVKLRCDHSQAMLDLASRLHPTAVALGDVCTDSLLHPICQASDQTGTLAAGVACQPYSKLGDNKQEHDMRAQTLPSVLRYGFLCRFGAIIIECVADAHSCPWVQSVVRTFADITGYKVAQGTLHLHTLWPARRSRWWCILTHASIGEVTWQPMPFSTAMPLVADLIDQFKSCTKEELDELALDLYELGRFDAQGFEQNEIPWKGQMATSLHSCGNQLSACPCKCRLFPFSDDRLARKGLHGLLVRLNDMVRCGQKEYPCFRHVHPAELALFNGMLPNMEWGPHLRMSLCALGQLASPIQSTWIGSLLMRAVQTMSGSSEVIDPFENLLQWLEKLLEGRDAVFGPQTNPNALRFQDHVKTRVYATKTKPHVEHVEISVPKPTRASDQDEQMRVEPFAPGNIFSEAKPAEESKPDTNETPDENTDFMIASKKRKLDTSFVADHQPTWTIPTGGGVCGFEAKASKARKKLSVTDVSAANSPTEFATDGPQLHKVRCDTHHEKLMGIPQEEIPLPACIRAPAAEVALHPKAMEPNDLPVPPFQAMPLPRLGCGGPTRDVKTPAPRIPTNAPHDDLTSDLPVECNPKHPCDATTKIDEARRFMPDFNPPTTETLPMPNLSGAMIACPPKQSPSEPTVPAESGIAWESPRKPTSGRSNPSKAEPMTSDRRLFADVPLPKRDQATHLQTHPKDAKPSIAELLNHVAPPTCRNAMPSPRLGCEGPSHVGGRASDFELPAAGTKVSQPGDNQDATPTRRDAMPSPRLGCEGPSHVGGRTCDFELPAAGSKVSQPCDHHDASPTRRDAMPSPRLGCEGPSHVGGRASDFELHAAGTKVSQPCDSHDASPTRRDAMPSPRLGCEGPSHVGGCVSVYELPVAGAKASQPSDCLDTPLTRFHAMPSPRLGCEGPSHGGGCTSDFVSTAAGADVSQPFDCRDAPPTLFQAMPSPRLGCEGPSPDGKREHSDRNEVRTDLETHETSMQTFDSSETPNLQLKSNETMTIFVKTEQSKHPIPCTVPTDCTVGRVTKAEANLGALNMPIVPRSLVGTHLPLDTTLHPDQHVLLFQTLPKCFKCPFVNSRFVQPPSVLSEILPCTRLEALWHQQAWVATDEMNFYLEATLIDDRAYPFPTTVFLHEADADATAGEWMELAFDSLDKSKPWCSAAIVASHWVPVIIKHHETSIQFVTTPEGTCLIPLATQLAHAQNKTIEVSQKLLPQVFQADCGFQTLAWLIALLHDGPLTAISATRAAQWRQLFVRELLEKETGAQLIHHLPLGGAKLDASDMNKLTTLLTQHGVPPERANDRAGLILSQLPVSTIKSILTSSRPWPDLKAAANGVKPQLKLIQPDELNAQIAHRAEQRKYGKKATAQRRHEPAKDVVNVQASELLVPQGVFKQEDGEILGPIQIGDVGPNAKGVLLLDQADCQATLRLPKPVTQNGLAIIVLATKDNADLHNVAPTRFPAMCTPTQEPIIASGYMYQLGSQAVIRHEPNVKLAIEEQPTEAMRCLVFKDQAGDFWDQLQQQPVKQIFQTEPLLATPPGSTSVVIDVWDRQWVSKKFEKVRPANAEVFMFSLRMMADKADELLSKSGQAGVFWEPRSPCGRYPNSSYHVTWLPHMSYQDAKYAQQTSPQVTTLARHGDRYGLRCDTMNAQAVHEKHKPDTPLLLGQTKMMFAVGPLPYSTTKAALHKLLKAWEWDARPLQPKGRAQDGSGVTWHIQAVEDPGHWVYTLQHGDVLITKIHNNRPANQTKPFSIVASKKTLDHLQGNDPWAHYDPWRKDGSSPAAQPSTVLPKPQSNPVTHAQLAAMEANLDKKIQQISKPSDGDAPMETVHMEARLTHLEQQFQKVQAMQIGTDHKVGQLQHQLEQQSQALGDRIDEKLNGHMERIEMLLHKRSRHE